MRLLLYGFGPYKQFRENITAKIVNALPRKAGLKTVVFPVRFRGRQFIEALEKHKPDVVLGLGQSSRGRIEIESRGVNRRRDKRGDAPRPIVKNGARWLATTLPIKPSSPSHSSKNAGTYVCNYSMYVILDHIKRNKSPIHFGFIHIPYDYDLEKARRFLNTVMQKLTSGRKGRPRVFQERKTPTRR
jgi:pyroglutamyl-peptidase